MCKYNKVYEYQTSINGQTNWLRISIIYDKYCLNYVISRRSINDFNETHRKL